MKQSTGVPNGADFAIVVKRVGRGGSDECIENVRISQEIHFDVDGFRCAVNGVKIRLFPVVRLRHQGVRGWVRSEQGQRS